MGTLTKGTEPLLIIDLPEDSTLLKGANRMLPVWAVNQDTHVKDTLDYVRGDLKKKKPSFMPNRQDLKGFGVDHKGYMSGWQTQEEPKIRAAHTAVVKWAIDNGKFGQAINRGTLTHDEAADAIRSAGLPIPDYIKPTGRLHVRESSGTYGGTGYKIHTGGVENPGSKPGQMRLAMSLAKSFAGLSYPELRKSHVKGHYRRLDSGKVVYISDYWTKRQKRLEPAHLRRSPAAKELKAVADKSQALTEARIRAGEVFYSKSDPSTLSEPVAQTMTIDQTVGDAKRQWYMTAHSDCPESELVFACVREALQNGLDAIFKAIREKKLKHGEFKVDFSKSYEGSSYVGKLSISDNGIGMDLNTIKNVYMSLGTTGKADDRTAIGGYGIAKAFILGVVDPDKGGTWNIRTREWEVSSEDMGQKKTYYPQDYQQGVTLSFDNIPSKHWAYKVEDKIKALLMMTDTGGKCDLYFNGEKVEPMKVDMDDAEREVIAPETLTKGIELTAYVHPRLDDGFSVVRLHSPAGYTMPQLIKPMYSIKADVVLDMECSVRPGQSGYPFDKARMNLLGGVDTVLEQLKDQLRADPNSVEMKHQYTTKVFGKDPEEQIAEQHKAVKAALGSDAQAMISAIQQMAAQAREMGYGSADSPGSELYDPSVVSSYDDGYGSGDNKAVTLAAKIDEAIEKQQDYDEDEDPLGKLFIVRLDKDYPDGEKWKITPQGVKELVAWDSILHAVCDKLVQAGSMQASTASGFKPGFILKKEDWAGRRVNAMNCIHEYEPSIAEKLGREKDRALLFNPENIKGDTPFQKAFWLYRLAVHEVTHYYQGEHNEDFTGAEANIHEICLPALEQILAIGELAFGGKVKASAANAFLTQKVSNKQVDDGLPHLHPQWQSKLQSLVNTAKKRAQEQDWRRTTEERNFDDEMQTIEATAKDYLDWYPQNIEEEFHIYLTDNIESYQKDLERAKKNKDSYSQEMYGGQLKATKKVYDTLYGAKARKAAQAEREQPSLLLSLGGKK